MSAVCVSIIQGICWLWLSTNFISGWQLFGGVLGYLSHSLLSITPRGLALPLVLCSGPQHHHLGAARFVILVLQPPLL